MSVYLAEMLSSQAQVYVKQACDQMDALAVIAGQLEASEMAIQLRETRTKMESDNFNLIVVGRYKNGKSTLLNAMLGSLTKPVPELEGSTFDGPLPTDDLPATARLTRICYADQAEVIAWHNDGRREPWTLRRYLTEGTKKPTSEETQRFFASIREFELRYPAELCKAGITLLDSPGLGDEIVLDQITKGALAECDAAIVVYRHDQFAGQDERVFVKEDMERRGVKRYFTVVNLMNGRIVDDRLKLFVWDRLITDMRRGEAYAGQDLASQDIYFVDLKKAAEGSWRRDRALVQASGLEILEQRLGEFLERDCLETHISRWIDGADILAIELEGEAHRRLASLRIEQDQFRASYEAIQPELQDIHRRRNRMQRVFSDYLKQAQMEARTSFEWFAAQLPEVLKAEMVRRPLVSLEGEEVHLDSFWERVTTPIRQKQLAEDASRLAKQILKEQVETWSEIRLPQDLEPVIARMVEEIKAEVAAIEEQFAALAYELTGWRPEVVTIEAGPKLGERVGWIAGGILSGNLDMALFGGALGWKGVAVGMGVEIATAIALIGLAGIAAPIAIPVAIVAGLMANIGWGARRADNTILNIKQKVAEALITGDPKERMPSLGDQLADVKPQVDEAVTKVFAALQTQVTQAVDSAITVQEQSLRALLEANQRSIGERAVMTSETQDLLRGIATARLTLGAMLTVARQM